jgi:hypothetical protein
MTKESKDDTWEEVDKMEEGKVCFYESGFDYPPTKTYKFNDAHLIYFKEIFYADGWQPIQTIITISPAIQNYGTEFPKRWNVSWILPSERTPYQSIENEERIQNFYITDTKGNENPKYKVGDIIFLNIKSINKIGNVIDIKLKDKTKDFKYKGKVLPNDTISNYTIKDDNDSIRLEVIKEQS